MTIKLGSLSRWRPYMGDAVVLGGTEHRERRIRLHFNCESDAAIYRVWPDNDEQQLIAVVPAGLETVEFQAGGEVRFIAVPVGGTEVWYQTADIEPTYAEVNDPEIFTKLATRRHRNPELEEMMYRMQLNMERRFADQAGEFEAAIQRNREEQIHAEPDKPPEPAPTNVGDSAPEVRPPDSAAGTERPQEGAGGDGKQQSGPAGSGPLP